MDTIYAMLKQTFSLTKHVLNCKQKCETWSDTCSKSEGLPWPGTQRSCMMVHATLILLRMEDSHTLYFTWICFKRDLKKISFLISSQHLLPPTESFIPILPKAQSSSQERFLTSPVLWGQQGVMVDPSFNRYQEALLTSCMESRSLVSW